MLGAKSKSLLVCGAVCAALAAYALGRDAGAHCDTMDGPVVAEAKLALEKGDPTRVLKWIAKDREDEVRNAFKRTLDARKASPEARDVADTWFFETVVRVHRAGEGMPYTGLKPAGTPLEAGVHEADEALASGKVDGLADAIAASVSHGVKHRFARALAAKERADESVEAGREYVAAYVEFVHYVERLHADVAAPAHHHAERPAEAPAEGGHETHDPR